MKKLFSLVCCAAMLLGFVACEDVPAPYKINNNGETDTRTIFSETFASSLGKFINYCTDGDASWKNSYSCATATGYDSSTKLTTDGTAYLVSPSIDLTDVDTAYVSYDYILQYNRKDAYQKLVICADSSFSTLDVVNSGWEDLITTHTAGASGDWTTFYSAAAQIPAKYLGKKIRLALRFQCETSSSTWEVKNFLVSKDSPSNGGNEDNPLVDNNSLPYTSTSFAEFEIKTITGTAWSGGSSYCKASGYNSDGTYTPTETWLISPAINTTVDTDEPAYIDFNYVIRFLKSEDIKDLHKVLISTDYDGNPSTANWTDLNFDAQASSTNTWDFYAAKSIQIPTEFMNKEKVYIAFKFTCGSSNSTTWEVKGLNIHQGESGSGDSGETDPQPTGDNLLANGDFESWASGEPTCWKSTTTASSADLSQSNDAHGGSYSVKVAGNTAANKRLAYKEITLKAGTYNLKFYVKAATSDGGSVRPGYVPVTDGKVGTYVYGDYVNDLSTSTWTEVNHSFTLSAETTVNIVVMNSKSPGGDVLIDDMTLTTSDGGSGETTGEDTGSNTGSGVYSIDFLSSTSGWTEDNIDLGDLTYVWKQNTTYGMKASAYASSTNHAAEAWYISPSISIPSSGATLTINQALNFLSGNTRSDYVNVCVITASGAKETLTLSTWPDGASYTYVDCTASLAKYAGTSIKIAFHYKSTSECAPTWEIKSVNIK